MDLKELLHIPIKTATPEQLKEFKFVFDITPQELADMIPNVCCFPGRIRRIIPDDH